MTDVVVTVPKKKWIEWLAEGDLPGSQWVDSEYHFWVAELPKITPGERVYIVAHGRLRGYSPLVSTEICCRLNLYRSCLIRRGDAVAVTIPEPIVGFQGWRYRWWDRSIEVPFPDWKEPGASSI